MLEQQTRCARKTLGLDSAADRCELVESVLVQTAQVCVAHRNCGVPRLVTSWAVSHLKHVQLTKVAAVAPNFPVNIRD